MPVPMTRPWRHPKTGVLWLRKTRTGRSASPRRKAWQSLKTKDAGEAKVCLVQALVELEARWANLRKGLTVLTEADAHKLAMAAYNDWIGQHAANPTEQRFWDTEIWAAGPWGHTLKRVAFIGYRLEQMQRLCFNVADKLLADTGTTTDTIGRERLAFAVGAAIQRG